MSVIPYRAVLDTLDTYIPGKPIEEVQKEYNLTEVIKLASNENPLGPSPNVIETLAAYAASSHIYPDGNCTILKEALAEFYGLSVDNFVVGNGSDELLMLIAMAYVSPHDEVLISNQTFSEYLFTSKCMDALVTVVPQADYRYDLRGFAAALSPKTKVMYLCNPNNPTGTIFTRQEFEQLLAAVPQNVLIVVDEAYYEYVTNNKYPQTLTYINDHSNLLILRTFSKVYGLAGLRVGYAIGHPSVIAAMNRVREPFNVNSLAQTAAKAALQDQIYVQTVKQLNQQAKDYLYQQFELLNIPYVRSEANFVLFEVIKDARIVFQDLLQQGVIVRPMNGFGLPHHIRVSTGTLQETEKFVKSYTQTALILNKG